jgi:hypothetical protein
MPRFVSPFVRHRSVSVAAVGVLSLSLLTACTPGGGPREGAAPAVGAAARETLPPTPTETPRPDPVEYAVTPQTITDVPLGHAVEVTDVVRHFSADGGAEPVRDGAEVVLVKLAVTAGSTYYASVSQNDFGLLTTSGGVAADHSNYTYEDDMASAGYEVLSRVGHGESAAGWIAFELKHPKDELFLKYERAAANAGAIEASSAEVPLVTAG